MMIITECCASWTCIFWGGELLLFLKDGNKNFKTYNYLWVFSPGLRWVAKSHPLVLWLAGMTHLHQALVPRPCLDKGGPLEDKKPAMKSFKPPSQPQHQRKRKNRCLHLFGLKNLDRSHKTSFFSILWFLISFFWIFNHFCNLDVCFVFLSVLILPLKTFTCCLSSLKTCNFLQSGSSSGSVSGFSWPTSLLIPLQTE